MEFEISLWSICIAVAVIFIVIMHFVANEQMGWRPMSGFELLVIGVLLMIVAFRMGR